MESQTELIRVPPSLSMISAATARSEWEKHPVSDFDTVRSVMHTAHIDTALRVLEDRVMGEDVPQNVPNQIFAEPITFEVIPFAIGSSCSFKTFSMARNPMSLSSVSTGRSEISTW